METHKIISCYCNIPGKHDTCVFCHNPLTKTHICSGWIEYSRPDRLYTPRWIEPSEHRKYGSALSSLLNFNGPIIN